MDKMEKPGTPRKGCRASLFSDGRGGGRYVAVSPVCGNRVEPGSPVS